MRLLSCFGLSSSECKHHLLPSSPSSYPRPSLVLPFSSQQSGVVLDKTVLARFPLPDNAVLHTYIWIDGTGQTLRSKIRVLSEPVDALEDVQQWTYDGSSTYQATGQNSDVLLLPVAWCRDPFMPGNNARLVLCHTMNADGTPTNTNRRLDCQVVAEQTEQCLPWFAFEQEYTLMGTDGRPLGFPLKGSPQAQGPYYCADGAGRVAGRDISDAHLRACIYAGLAIGGTNAEVLLGQWEYQIGPLGALQISDQLWLSRYILERVAEEYGVGVSFDPKPLSGDWNGAGNHCNFSTKAMREEGGIKAIYAAIEKLSARHQEHIADYDPSGGVDNRRRLTGKHETASADEFSSGEGSRTTSVRIPRNVVNDGKGYLEDRRPSANCDPYAVVSRLLRTICLDNE